MIHLCQLLSRPEQLAKPAKCVSDSPAADVAGKESGQPRPAPSQTAPQKTRTSQKKSAADASCWIRLPTSLFVQFHV
ncbi:hypothetical protein Q5P01_012796 [Channa striata]|uniref:Uncharacterized protein n=1 Tax=Channa striata TaxID=64152 RepID=A0AA88MSH1_CHASR|nr:hypothetical protein Q5P01_012796 [Channa striata]